MAKQLEGWPVGLEPRRGAEPQYPWDQWLNGRVWELASGEDYKIKTKSFRTAAMAYARKKGGRLRAAEINNGSGLVIQYLPGGAPALTVAPSPDDPAPAPYRPPRADDRTAAIRSWARANGWPDIADFGRLPGDVVQAYERAEDHPHGAT